MNTMKYNLTNRLFDPFFNSFFNFDDQVIDNHDKDELNYKLNLAGTKKDDIKLSSMQDHLLLETPKKKYKLSMPHLYDPDSVEAKYEDGLLTVTINKKKEYKAQQIEIE